MNPPDTLKEAIAYGRRLRDDDHTAYGLSNNEQRLVLLASACEDMARALHQAVTFARAGKVANTGAWENWHALAEAIQ
jgi:hypothetical protein